ncbi:hypothetical protein [Caulobacter sp. UNC279MFTsu5.1]|uniref:hypothetical protein n=1 Tax=Caulobacter sp. UNC279MFTsu5.1 TaxID=1502775 RepID=UPI0004981832|nr:hypothetical protein [Caulobacter sp. UNC279MFTsu5.1]SFJ47784.1 hypothetical protein SAMN02799626_01887 [Caulobacter sp. UNC279MFTsu5.1]
MKNLMILVGAVLALAASPGVVSAQATRTWVSGVGDDVNPCSRTAPCKTFAGAISKTAAGGEINVLDPGGFGTVTITKSITIGTDPAMGGILNAASNGVIVNAAATDVVTLRGLVISAPAGASTGLNGVRILNAATVNIENSYIYGNRALAPNGNGIVVQNTSGTVRLNVTDTLVSENGSASTDGGGIVVIPTGTGGAIVNLERVIAIDNSRGVRLDASGTSGSVKTTITNSNISSNTLAGIHNVSNGSVASTYISDTISANNSGGLNSIGAGSVVTINRSSFFGNNTGLQVVSGGLIQSYSNNSVNGNSVDGAPTSTITPK